MSYDTNRVVAELHPTQYLAATPETVHEFCAVALIILNCPISSYEHFRRLYNHATYTVCADGGANRLHDLLVKQFPDVPAEQALRRAAPDLIHGDLDSLTDRVRQRYEAINVDISQDPDQYSTDFGKAIKQIAEKAPKTRDVLVLGSIGGRIDQGIGLLHEMYREQRFAHPNLRFWLFSETSVSVLLLPGTTVIHTPLSGGLIKANVGILPLYGKAKLSLTGFEWDVEDWPSEMGGQVSTSNHIMGDRLSVTTDTTVLFTVERGIGR